MGLTTSWHCYCDNPSCYYARHDVFGDSAPLFGASKSEARAHAKEQGMTFKRQDGREILVCRQCSEDDED